MDLGRDAFRIDYDPLRLDVDAVMLRIRGLGYRPETIAELAADPPVAAFDPDTVPAPVNDALARARATNRLALIEFYASWCGPCKELESTTLRDPSVRAALENYEFVTVDTDRYVESTDHFRVVGLPTLLALDSAGREVQRWEGRIEAESLAAALRQLAGSQKP